MSAEHHSGDAPVSIAMSRHFVRGTLRLMVSTHAWPYMLLVDTIGVRALVSFSELNMLPSPVKLFHKWRWSWPGPADFPAFGAGMASPWHSLFCFLRCTWLQHEDIRQGLSRRSGSSHLRALNSHSQGTLVLLQWREPFRIDM